MKKIAVFTSGGDAPGMNACIRAVVRTAAHHQLEISGIMHGYEGMMNGEFIPLPPKSVANIIQRGGTVLKTSRSEKFHSKEGREKAFEHIQKNKIDALIAIGGDGTFRAASVFESEFNIPIIGIPGTIDNDLIGTDYTIGYDTAINTVIDALDKIRDTAESHERLFIVEVMGRDAGLIALRTGIASGAMDILIPEIKTDHTQLIHKLKNGRKDKTSKIIIVAEGDEAGGAIETGKKIKLALPHYDVRITVLGHIQRGGNPSCMDRVLASRLGFAAVEALIQKKHGVMVGSKSYEIIFTPFENAVKHISQLNPEWLKMMEILSA